MATEKVSLSKMKVQMGPYTMVIGPSQMLYD
jgi:hypothetical protein